MGPGRAPRGQGPHLRCRGVGLRHPRRVQLRGGPRQGAALGRPRALGGLAPVLQPRRPERAGSRPEPGDRRPGDLRLPRHDLRHAYLAGQYRGRPQVLRRAHLRQRRGRLRGLPPLRRRASGGGGTPLLGPPLGLAPARPRPLPVAHVPARGPQPGGAPGPRPRPRPAGLLRHRLRPHLLPHPRPGAARRRRPRPRPAGPGSDPGERGRHAEHLHRRGHPLAPTSPGRPHLRPQLAIGGRAGGGLGERLRGWGPGGHRGSGHRDGHCGQPVPVARPVGGGRGAYALQAQRPGPVLRGRPARHRGGGAGDDVEDRGPQPPAGGAPVVRGRPEGQPAGHHPARRLGRGRHRVLRGPAGEPRGLLQREPHSRPRGGRGVPGEAQRRRPRRRLGRGRPRHPGPPARAACPAPDGPVLLDHHRGQPRRPRQGAQAAGTPGQD